MKFRFTPFLFCLVPAFGAVNTGIWFDGTSSQVNTGGGCVIGTPDCNDSKMGIWFDYDDRANDNGDSYIVSPFAQPGQMPPDNYIQQIVDSLGYLAIDYKLVKPSNQNTEYPYNFAGMAFHTVDDKGTTLDMTDAKGLCVTYTSDDDVTLEVVTPNDGGDHCYVTLPKNIKTQLVSSKISEFKQPSYTEADNKLSSCEEAFSNASRINLKIDGQARNAQGRLRIFELGAEGSCSGNGTVKIHRDRKLANEASVRVSGEMLYVDGQDSKFNYEIVDMQGAVVKRGVSAGSVSLKGIRTGSYMILLKGSTTKTKLIQLK